jgi:FtsH-binding integral membrane protein
MLIATFGLVMFISFRIDRLQPTTALSLFLVYAALLGVFLSSIFIQYTGTSITRVFFISAASFGALSLYGYTTQRDLSAFGSFLMIGLVGLVLAILVEMGMAAFGIRSSMFSFIISVVGVLVFAGLTAWDTQKIKEMYDANEDGTITARKAVMGALTLYLDFINLFLFLLRLIGDRR